MADEVRVTRTLVQFGYRAIARGGRHETFDVEVLESPSFWPDQIKAEPGRYEVKRLSRSGNSFDRRFKTSGARGSRIYGRHSALIKAAALELEDNMKYLNFTGWTAEDVDEVEARRCFCLMLEDAFSDRHSHRFRQAFDRICHDLVGSFPAVDRYLQAPSLDDKIMSGYSDLDGLFIIRGDTYTLIKRNQIPRWIGFDSFGSEGLKLRILGVVSDKSQRSGKVKR